MSTRQAHVREAPSRNGGMVFLFILGLGVALGGYLVYAFTQREEIPHVTAPTEPFKVRPPEGVFDTLGPGESLDDVLDEPRGDESRQDERRRDEARRDERRRDESRRDERWRGELQSPQPEPRQRRWSPAAAPYFVANGPYVAQVAALQSEAEVEEAWQRLSSRAPHLFEPARLDVERADLGPRGVFYRIRAGYFSDRGNAERFCERVQRMGQDCHVTGR